MGKSYLTYCFVLFVILFFKTPALAQLDPQIEIDAIISDYLEDAPEEFDYSELYDRLYDLYLNPVNLNTANNDELSYIFFLNDRQVDDIQAYKKRYRGFMTIYELKNIQSLDPLTLKRLIMFVNVKEVSRDDTAGFFYFFKYGRNTVMAKYEQTLEKRAGYKAPDTAANPDKQYYKGSPQKLYLRYNFVRRKNLSYGITMEKDPGEEFFKGNQKQGFDYYSAHFYYGDRKHIKHLALGDYYANFGQGLIFQTGFSMGKSPYVLNLFKSQNEIRPYRSVNESLFLRGGATTLQFKNIRITAFYSNKKIDGNIEGTDTIDNNSSEYISSFYNTGYHRTPGEIEKKKTIREQITGGNIHFSWEKAELGFTAVHGFFDKPLQRNSRLYSQFDFNGDQFTNISSDFVLSFNRVFAFGEFGWDTKNFAGIGGAVLNLTSNLNAGILYRNYPKDFVALYGNSFREGGSNSNEQGLYFSLEYRPASKWKISMYIDRFDFPWLRYLTDLPSHGHEYFTEVHYYPSYHTNMYVRFKYEKKPKNLSNNESHFNQLADNEKLSARYHFSMVLNDQVRLRTRVEYALFNTETEESSHGLLTYQDVDYFLFNKKLRLTGRFALFNIDDYNARIYTYEYDIYSSFSIPAFFDKGIRYYFMLRYKPMENLSFDFKVSRTSYFNRDEISSGLNLIKNNHQTDIKALVRFRF